MLTVDSNDEIRSPRLSVSRFTSMILQVPLFCQNTPHPLTHLLRSGEIDMCVMPGRIQIRAKINEIFLRKCGRLKKDSVAGPRRNNMTGTMVPSKI